MPSAPIHVIPYRFVGNTVDAESMKLLGARAIETSTDLALENAPFIIFLCRLNLLIEERY
jgi:hypothetical protein